MEEVSPPYYKLQVIQYRYSNILSIFMSITSNTFGAYIKYIFSVVLYWCVMYRFQKQFFFQIVLTDKIQYQFKLLWKYFAELVNTFGKKSQLINSNYLNYIQYVKKQNKIVISDHDSYTCVVQTVKQLNNLHI